MVLNEWREACFDLLFPKFCFGCRREGSFLCDSCRLSLLLGSPSCPVCSRRNFDGVLCASCQEKAGLRRFFAPFPYSSRLVRELIHALKYRGIRELAPELAGYCASLLNIYRISLPLDALIVPIPLHPRRERERGFNQAMLLASELGRCSGRPVFGALVRRRNTSQQVSLDSFEERWKNMENAFALADPGKTAPFIRGRAAILVDDVSTSGATLAEAADALRRAGARTVWAIVIAKG